MSRSRKQNRSRTEKRSAFVQTPAGVKAISLGAYPSDSGVVVNAETAEQSTTFLACLGVIADDFGGLPIRLVQTGEDGRKRRLRSHRLYKTLNQEPNKFCTSIVHRTMKVRSLGLYGIAYELIYGDEIYLIHPARVSTEVLATGDRLYHVRDKNNKTHEFREDQICVTFYQTDDGIHGKAPLQVAANAVGIAIAADTHAGKFFGNGTTLSGYLKYPGQLQEGAEEELVRSWAEKYSGSSNAHKVPVLFEGGDFVPLSVTPEQAQFLQSRQWQVEEICRLWRVNPLLVGATSKSSWAYYSVMSNHARTCIRPWCIRSEQEYNRKLLTEQEKAEGISIEYDLDGMMRGDRQSQDKSFATGKQFGWYSTNDVRGYLNLDPIEGGDRYNEPLNMQSVGDDANTETTEQPIDDSDPLIENADPVESSEERSQTPGQLRRDDADRLNPILQDAVRRSLVKEVNAIKRAEGKGDLKTWANDWYGPHESLVRSMVLPAFAAYEPATAQQRSAEYAKQHVEESKRDIGDALDFDSLNLLYDNWTERRAFKADLSNGDK